MELEDLTKAIYHAVSEKLGDKYVVYISSDDFIRIEHKEPQQTAMDILVFRNATLYLWIPGGCLHGSDHRFDMKNPKFIIESFLNHVKKIISCPMVMSVVGMIETTPKFKSP